MNIALCLVESFNPHIIEKQFQYTHFLIITYHLNFKIKLVFEMNYVSFCRLSRIVNIIKTVQSNGLFQIEKNREELLRLLRLLRLLKRLLHFNTFLKHNIMWGRDIRY